ncbi:SUKH-3 domain-containing protein [Hymenobacter tibetensis]|uniref:SUKH-3 domain-containing protein n=1 Tax=Hymenobacter tibetensis TaxID=497967 RepID=A0ABY4D4J7_9BACT|nr:SUKH-3 domain-containing protein [Hymenobacter tibetensis]UOG74873.1 SUKH-3 domain-containing protein [Hymenobacter tibetensis]
MFAFFSEVHHLLTEAGWFPGRTVDTKLYRQQASRLGLPWLPAAEAFLREFGGLSCYFTRHDHSTSRVFFDVEKGAAFPDLAYLLQEYSVRVPHGVLSVVGLAYTDPLCLLMDQDGALYGAFHGGFYRIASAGVLGIEAILLDWPFKEVLAKS